MDFDTPRNYEKSCIHYFDNGSEVVIIYPVFHDGSIAVKDVKFVGDQAQAMREILSAERVCNIGDASTTIEKWLDKLIADQMAQANIAEAEGDDLHCSVCNLTADIIRALKTNVQPILYKSLIKESIQPWRQTDDSNQI